MLSVPIGIAVCMRRTLAHRQWLCWHTIVCKGIPDRTLDEVCQGTVVCTGNTI